MQDEQRTGLATDPATPALPVRQARQDGLALSMMGLGCMGMSEFYGASDDARSREIILAALDGGVRLFDTADIYGYGHNERLVGSVLCDHPLRSQVVLATKGGILRDQHDPKVRGVDNSPEYLRAAIARSLDRLQTPIDLYYVHRIQDDGARVEETMSALADAILAGKIGAAGLSEVQAETVERADAALRRFTDGRHGLAAVQTEYSLMTRHIEIDGVDATCRRLGILLVAYSPMSRGLLATPDFDPSTFTEADSRRGMPRFQGENLAHNRGMVEVLFEVAAAEGITPAQAALAWVLSRGPHVVPIPGSRKRERLDENLQATRIRLGERSLTRLNDTFAPLAAAGERYGAVSMKAYGFRH